MRPLLIITLLFILFSESAAQVEIRFDHVFNGQAYFTITDEVAIERIENGEKLFIWGWSSHQLDTLSDGIIYINGYNSNFQMLSNSTFKSTRYWHLPLGKQSWAWATFDQPFGHRPPLTLINAENKVEFANYLFGLPCYLADYLTEHENDHPLKLSSKLHPNPTTGLFVIRFHELMDVKSVRVVDASGRLVMEKPIDLFKIYQPEIEMDLKNQKDGIYFIQLITSRKVVSRKLVLQRN